MTGAGALLGAALALPLGMLLACLSPQLKARMPALLALAPLPALAAALLAPGGALVLPPVLLSVRLALDVPGAILLGAAALLWIAGGRYATAWLRRSARRRPLRSVVAADARRQHRRLHGRRPGELLPGVLHGQPCGVWPDRRRRHAARPALRPDLRGAGGARRGLPADGLRAAGAGHARRVHADPRRRGGIAGIALARFDPGAADPRLRREDRPCAVPCVDAARLSGGADPGRRRAQRRGGQGRRDRADPLPAAGHRAVGMGRGAGRRRALVRLLRRRDRHHAVEPKDGAGLFQREPDGRDRRRAWHGARRRRWRGRRCP